MKKKTRKKGFTLVEVLVVMAIIALLAATAIPKVKGIYQEAQLDKAEADALQIAAAIQRVELKYELSGTNTTLFDDIDVLSTADFELLNVQIKGGNYVFRYSKVGLEDANKNCRVIQIYDSKSTLSATTPAIKEVIIPE